MRKDYLVFGSPLIEEDEIQEVLDTIRSGWLGTGPKTHRFEGLFAEYLGVEHCVAVNSCTAALHLAMLSARRARRTARTVRASVRSSRLAGLRTGVRRPPGPRGAA